MLLAINGHANLSTTCKSLKVMACQMGRAVNDYGVQFRKWSLLFAQLGYVYRCIYLFSLTRVCSTGGAYLHWTLSSFGLRSRIYLKWVTGFKGSGLVPLIVKWMQRSGSSSPESH